MERKSYTAEFKTKVVLESLQRDTTLEQVCQRFGVSKSMVHRWRNKFQEKAPTLFTDKRNPSQKAINQGYKPGESPDELKKIIGELTVQNEILKKYRGSWATKTGAEGRTGLPTESASWPLLQEPGRASFACGASHALLALQAGAKRSASGSRHRAVA
ncbi:hypothetical protein KSX_53280 [Ktedonospora formicarum]|uniref:Transposase n=1 Tax=Ktedonospora formicarum TaxID=2778364 RepID=A0A8J3MW45_9CHLR|nr:hypothetical protein KSX_53280 [Ktedonospora formicarum]